jgi:20S proteasome alpha/beta subunit
VLPKPPFDSPKKPRLPKRKPMTIAIGFNCWDGLVLCADSLESDGVTKSFVNKIWSYETQGEWGIAVAGAGEADFCESFTDNLTTMFKGEPFDKDRIMLQLRQAINGVRTSYPDLEWSALFALFGPDEFDRRLLRVSRDSKHLAPVNRYEAVGIGSHLAKFFCSQLCTVFVGVDEAIELGIFVTRRCIEHVDGCDGPISVLSWKVKQDCWTVHHPNQIQEIEDRFGSKTLLRRNLVEFWHSLTPHVLRTAPKFSDASKGGSVNSYMALPKSRMNKPKRSSSLKSKRFP